MTGAEFSEVDIDLLADYIGGALTGTPEESAVAARIADDPAWQTAFASLSEGMAFVSAELGRLGPEPMPAELAARLDTALTGASPAELDPSLTGLPTAELDPSLTGLPTAELDPSPAGAVAAGMQPAATHPEAEPIADPEPIAPALAQPPSPHLTLVHGDLAGGDVPDRVREKAPAPRRGRRLRWAAPIAVAAGLIAFVGFGLDYLAGRSGQSSSGSSADTAAGSAEKAPSLARPFEAAKLLASGTDYTHATLGTEPLAPLTAPLASPKAATSGSAPTRAPRVDAGSPLQRLIATAALDDCLAAIEQENAAGAISVESVDYARFGSAPAVIVRFIADNGRWAWASGAGCGSPAGDAATLDKVPVG